MVLDTKHSVRNILNEDEIEGVTEEEKESALRVWDNISWADEAAKSTVLRDKYDANYWSSKTMSFDLRYEEETLVGHKLNNGFYTVHDIEIPFDVFIDDAISRIERCLSWIEDQESNDRYPKLYEDSHKNMEDVPRRIDELSENSDKLTENIEVLDEE